MELDGKEQQEEAKENGGTSDRGRMSDEEGVGEVPSFSPRSQGSLSRF